MTVDHYNKDTGEVYIKLGLEDIIYVNKNLPRGNAKLVATVMNCLDVCTMRRVLVNIKSMIEIESIRIKVNKGVFLRRKSSKNLPKKAIYRIYPIPMKKDTLVNAIV